MNTDQVREALKCLQKSLSNKSLSQGDDRVAMGHAVRLLQASLAEEKVPYETVPDRGGELERHESFGVATLTRGQGNMKLFGAVSQYVPNFIRLRISRAEQTFGDHLTSRIHEAYEKPPLVEVFLTQTQWAELICSMNGVPVPVTLRAVGGVEQEKVPDEVLPPLEKIRQRAWRVGSRATTEAGEKAAELLNQAKKIVSESMPKGKAAQVIKLISDVQSNINEPITQAAYAGTRIVEEAEEALAHAKVEFSAYVEGTVQRLGVEALLEKNRDLKLLSDK